MLTRNKSHLLYFDGTIYKVFLRQDHFFDVLVQFPIGETGQHIRKCESRSNTAVKDSLFICLFFAFIRPW